VILDFGGDWCGDCQALDIYFHQAPNDALLGKNFVLVHVWIGHMDANLDVAKRYGVPINKACPRWPFWGRTGSCSTRNRRESLKTCATWSQPR